jgi:hypothetical protein
MRSLWGRHWFRLGVAEAVLLAAVLLGSATYFGIWSWRDWQVYGAMSRECHPVWRDLYWGRIQPGQPVDAVIAQTKPLRVFQFANFTELSYQEGLCFTGVTIFARDGKLVAASAWSCTWERPFFGSLSQDEWQARATAMKAYIDAKKKAAGR